MSIKFTLTVYKNAGYFLYVGTTNQDSSRLYGMYIRIIYVSHQELKKIKVYLWKTFLA